MQVWWPGRGKAARASDRPNLHRAEVPQPDTAKRVAREKREAREAAERYVARFQESRVARIYGAIEGIKILIILAAAIAAGLAAYWD